MTDDRGSTSAQSPSGDDRKAVGTPGITQLTTSVEIREALAAMGESTRKELVSVLPHGVYEAAALRSSWDADLAMLHRGVATAVIYPVEAARVPDIMSYLAEFAAAGAQIRVAARIPHRLVISDRTAAVLPADPDQPAGPALLVRQRVLVRSLHADFVGLWKTAWPVGFASRYGLDPAMVRETLSVLAKGLTDEAAARQTGVSVRTLRRRIASVMELLGAGSRFEAGIRAAEAGWI